MYNIFCVFYILCLEYCEFVVSADLVIFSMLMLATLALSSYFLFRKLCNIDAFVLITRVIATYRAQTLETCVLLYPLSELQRRFVLKELIVLETLDLICVNELNVMDIILILFFENLVDL